MKTYCSHLPPAVCLKKSKSQVLGYVQPCPSLPPSVLLFISLFLSSLSVTISLSLHLCESPVNSWTLYRLSKHSAMDLNSCLIFTFFSMSYITSFTLNLHQTLPTRFQLFHFLFLKFYLFIECVCMWICLHEFICTIYI